jgi:hypothetical protein
VGIQTFQHSPNEGNFQRENIAMTYFKDVPLPNRATLIRNAVETEFFGGGEWRQVVSPDGVVCYVTRIWGKDKDDSPERKAAA